VVVVAIIIAAAIILRHRKAVAPKNSAAITRSPIHIQPTYATGGDLANGFPSDLVLGTKPDITQSYSVPYGNQSQSTTSFQVQDSSDALFQSYLTYFQTNSYGIISKQQTKTLDSIYASNKDADISVTITQATGGSRADVSYLKK